MADIVRTEPGPRMSKAVVHGAAPARATVESRLAAPQFTVEIAVVAAV